MRRAWKRLATACLLLPFASCGALSTGKGTQGDGAGASKAGANPQADPSTPTPAAIQTSGPLVDPKLDAFLPARDATGVALGAALSVRFNVAPLDGQDFSKSLVLQDGPDSYVALVCRVVPAEKSLSCVPRLPLAPETLYTATLAESLAFPGGRVLPQGAVWSFRTTASDDRTPPTLSWSFREAGAVEQGAPLVLYFSEPVTWTGGASSVGVKTAAGAQAAGGTAKAFGNALEITLDATLSPGDHVLTVASGLTDLHENAFAGALVVPFSVRSGQARAGFSFDEGASEGLGSPQGGARAHGPWVLAFTEPLLPSAVFATGRLRVTPQAPGSADVPWDVRFTPSGVEVSPKTRLNYAQSYVLTLRGDLASWERAALDAGGAAQARTVAFTTQSALGLASVAPAEGQTEVALDAAWTATFDRPLAAGLRASDLVDVRDGLGRLVKVTARFGANGPSESTGVESTLTLRPETAWALSEDYSVTLLSTVRGADGAGFASPRKVTFEAKVDASWEAGPKRVFAARCTSCHLTYGNRSTAWEWASRIRGAVASNRMPLGGPLSASDKSAVVNWFDAAIAAGAP